MIPAFDKNSRVILMTVGLMASGKTTFARQLVNAEPSRWKRVNRDDIRLMLHGASHDYANPGHEKAVTFTSDAMTRAALEAGYDVVLDNTFLDAKSRSGVHAIAAEIGNCTVIEKVFATPLPVCLQRNAQRTGVACVPEDVIRKKAKQLQIRPDGTSKLLQDKVTEYKGLPLTPIVQDASLPPAIICDLDGTLCLINGRGPYDAAKCESDLPNQAVLNVLVNSWLGPSSHDSEIIFMSGRSSEHRPQTTAWLGVHLPKSMPYQLFMRAEGDTRKDSIVKKELFEQHVMNKYYVRFVLDDRSQVVELWRSLGLVCFQVAPGSF